MSQEVSSIGSTTCLVEEVDAEPAEAVAIEAEADMAEKDESANIGMEVEALSEPAINAVSMFGVLTGQHLLTSLKGNTCAEREKYLSHAVCGLFSCKQGLCQTQMLQYCS